MYVKADAVSSVSEKLSLGPQFPFTEVSAHEHSSSLFAPSQSLQQLYLLCCFAASLLTRRCKKLTIFLHKFQVPHGVVKKRMNGAFVSNPSSCGHQPCIRQSPLQQQIYPRSSTRCICSLENLPISFYEKTAYSSLNFLATDDVENQRIYCSLVQNQH